MKVVISSTLHPAGMELLNGKVEVVTMPDSHESTAKSLLSDADALILRTNIEITEEIIAAAPMLKIISRTGVGVDNVDVDAASARGIMVCNTPGLNANSVAEQTLALILATAKRLGEMDHAVRAGDWKIRNTYRARDLDGMTLGLVGIGRIGSLVAQKCAAALGMTIIAYDPFVSEAANIELVASLDDVFSRSDVISVHVPYTEQTHHLVNDRLLSLLKKDSLFINTSRGELVDEAALCGALESGRLAGVGLDVFTDEPPPTDHPLFEFPNVVTTPHSSALTRECVAKVAAAAAQAVVTLAEGGTPEFVFNAKALGL